MCHYYTELLAISACAQIFFTNVTDTFIVQSGLYKRNGWY